MTEAYPLQWPEGWPRTRAVDRQDDRRFAQGDVYQGVGDARRYVGRARPTVEKSNRRLHEELARLGATNVVVSTNLELRQDGMPYSNRRAPDDPGVAVYFMLKKKPLVMASDRYETVAGNLRSVGLAIEAMRQLERHGGGQMMDRAFTGFIAITGPSWRKPWREVFGIGKSTSLNRSALDSLYRSKARERHPDAGGADTLMAELNVAYEEAKKETAS